MSDKKLKILLLGDAGSFHIERFYSELQNQGCDVLLASLEDGIADSVKLQKNGIMKSLYYRFSVKQIKLLIKTFQPDIISAHFASGYGHIAALANRKKQIPLALNLWGSDILIVPHKSILHRYKTKFALRNADHVFADSSYLIDAAKKLFSFKSCTVIPWGVEKNIFKYYQEKETLSSPLSVFVPRAHEKVYNNLFIVESLKELIKSDKIKITFPAFGSLYDSFREKTNNIVGDQIRYYEKKERDEFLKFASEHDVYLSASLSDSSPVTLIEAMGLGLVPVVMSIDGVKEWVSDANGFMFDFKTESLFATVTNLINNKIDLTSMRASNKQKVLSTALFENNISEQLTIFKSLVEGRR